MIINQNHPFLAMSQELANICHPLKKLGITYFSYCKYYHNGERLWMTTHPHIIENYYKNKNYLIGNTESHPINYIDQAVLWSTLPNQRVFIESHQLGVSHGMFFIEPKDKYCEFTSFGTTPDNHQIINTYLTYFDWIKKFTQYFKEKANSLILRAEKNKIILPYHNKPGVFINPIKEMLLKKDKIKLTPRQMTCASLLVKGKTAKEISTELGLSRRTVETYINNLKIKFDCDNKIALIVKLTELNYFDH